MDKRIGAQYYTIRDFCKTIEDFDESCKKVAEIGYKTVQLSGIGNLEPDDIRKVLDKYSLEAICTHRPAQEFTDEFEKLVNYHKVTGCRYAGLGSMPGFNAKRETIESFIKTYDPIAKKLKEHGLILTYHNHAFEFEKIDGKYVFDILADGVKDMEFILDAYWLSYAGVNPAKYIKKHKDRIACVHFKDIHVVENQVGMCEVLEGNIDWDDVIEACEYSNVKYAFVEQDTCNGNPFDSLKISYDNLKAKGFC